MPKSTKISDLQTTINKLNLQLNDLEQQIKNFLHNLQDGQLNDLEQQMQALISERNTGTNRRTNRRTDILTRTAQNRLPGSENIDRLDSAAEPRHRRWRP